MDQRIQASKEHFDITQIYLGKLYDIRVRCEIIAKRFTQLENIDILDLGCGNGTLSLQFQDRAANITLVDVSENMLSEAKRNIDPQYAHKVQCIQSDIDSFNPDKKYDLVIGSGILAHVPSLDSAIEKISLCMKQQGTCFIQITDHSQILSKINLLYNHLLDFVFQNFRYKRNIFHKNDILLYFQKHGLKLISEDQYSLVFPFAKSLFSDPFLYHFTKSTAENPILSKLGSDFMLQFVKSE